MDSPLVRRQWSGVSSDRVKAQGLRHHQPIAQQVESVRLVASPPRSILRDELHRRSTEVAVSPKTEVLLEQSSIPCVSLVALHILSAFERFSISNRFCDH